MRYYALMFYMVVVVAFGAAAKRPMTVEDMWAMQRIGDIALSPDGEWIAFSVTKYDMEKNGGETDIWMIQTSGNELRRMTTASGYDGNPKWRPDGSALTFLSARNGSNQIYELPMQGGEARQLTHFPVDVDNFSWSSTGERIIFTATIFAEAKTLQESAERDKANEQSKVKAKVIDTLLFRHWNHWRNGKRSQVFICSSNGENVEKITGGGYDSPPISLGGSPDFTFSPQGNEIAFVCNRDSMVAASTNNDVFLYHLMSGEEQNLTANNPAVDNNPVYSPDGRFLAYRSMERAGFEADQYDIVLLNRKNGDKKILTNDFNRSPLDIVWSPDSKYIFFSAYHHGRRAVYRLTLESEDIEELLTTHYNRALLVAPDGKKLYLKQQAVNRPEEIFTYDIETKKLEQLSFLNQDLVNHLDLNPVEAFWFTSFDGKKAHGLMVKPPDFSSDKTYPLIYLIHGGPQGMWSDQFHYRWNSSMFAAPGYVVVMVNFRGSKGYGQEWCDAVSKNWGGGPYKDLMSGLDYLLDTYEFIDKEKVVAAGASYGGFMINWIATHTDRFKALVSHAGVFDQRSMYGATEELWFPEWEFNGTPYLAPELYKKWSPSFFVSNFKEYKTPTLVIHGQHDYRVPVTQGFQMFTALQRMGVPSRLIYFPDEYHFITKPQNARLWWNEIFGWFEKWLT